MFPVILIRDTISYATNHMRIREFLPRSRIILLEFKIEKVLPTACCCCCCYHTHAPACLAAPTIDQQLSVLSSRDSGKGGVSHPGRPCSARS